MRKKTADHRPEGREAWTGWLGSFLRTLRCQAFRLHIPGTSGMNSRLSAGPSVSELCSKFQAPPPQFQRMNQQEKPGALQHGPGRGLGAWQAKGLSGRGWFCTGNPRAWPLPDEGLRRFCLGISIFRGWKDFSRVGDFQIPKASWEA